MTSTKNAPARLSLTEGDATNDGSFYAWIEQLPGAKRGQKVTLVGPDDVIVDGEVLKVVGRVVRIGILEDTWRTEAPANS